MIYVYLYHCHVIHLIELNRSISPFHFFSDSKFIPGTPNKAYQDLVERRVQEATRQPTLQHRYQINNNNNKATNSTKTSFAKNVKKILELKTRTNKAKQKIIFVQLDKQSSLSNSTNNHLCPNRQTIIFVQLDEQSSLSNPTNNHLCQIRRTIILVKIDKQFFHNRISVPHGLIFEKEKKNFLKLS